MNRRISAMMYFESRPLDLTSLPHLHLVSNIWNDTSCEDINSLRKNMCKNDLLHYFMRSTTRYMSLLKQIKLFFMNINGSTLPVGSKDIGMNLNITINFSREQIENARDSFKYHKLSKVFGGLSETN